MPGLQMVLNTAKGAIAVQQYGINVTGHNIANVNNPSFSRQSVPHEAKRPAEFGRHVFGTGVQAQEIKRSVDELLETRLLNEKSTFSAYEESENYVDLIEKIFTVSSESGMNNLLPDFWNAWQEISDNPGGTSERVNVFQTADLIAKRFNVLNDDLIKLEEQINQEIEASVPVINTIAQEIAQLNNAIIGQEASASANDYRDKRNALLTELAEYTDVKAFEQPEGDLIVTIANGYSLVDGADSYMIRMNTGQIEYRTSAGKYIDITDNFTTGRISGWLDTRDEIVKRQRQELDVLAREFIWAVNYQHSQGVGLNYLALPMTGTYATEDSGRLDTLEFGKKIDYTKDFKMWIQDDSSGVAEYLPVEMDMSISDAVAGNWAGAGPVADYFRYDFTVVEAGQSGTAVGVTEADGVGLGIAQSGVDIRSALNSAIAPQTLTVTDAGGMTQTVDVRDVGGDAYRSAASIASRLNDLNGISAYAVENSATIDIATILGGALDIEENDLVSFVLNSAEKNSTVAFRVGTSDTITRANFQDALRSAVADINGAGSDLSVAFSGDTATIASAGGENIGVEEFDVQDCVVVTMDTFTNMGAATSVQAGNFTGLQTGEQVSFSITTALGSVNVDYTVTDDSSQTALAADLQNAMSTPAIAAALAGIGVSSAQTGSTVQIDGTAAASYLDFRVTSVREDLNEAFDIISLAGTSQYPPSTDNSQTLLFGQNGHQLQYAGDNVVTFTVNGMDTIQVDLRRLDTTDQTVLANAFYDAMNGNLTNATVTNNGAALEITATSEFASFGFTNGMQNGVASAATFDTSFNQGIQSAGGDTTFTFDTADQVEYNAFDQDSAQIRFDTSALTEDDASGTIVDSAVKASRINIFLEDGYSIQSSVAGTAADGGLFNAAAATDTTNIGDAMVVFGGIGGYAGFDLGETVSFEVDGTAIAYTIAGTTDTERAAELYTALNGVLGGYTVVQNGASVSLKNPGVPPAAPIEITNFSVSALPGGNPAALAVQNGYDGGYTLSNATPAFASALPGSEGTIEWKKYDSTGMATGDTGRIDVKTVGPYTVDGTLTFDLSNGDLVAGNTFSLNTDNTGAADPLTMGVSGIANSVLDTYVFKVESITSSGTAVNEGAVGNDEIILSWTNSASFGTIRLEATGAPVVPYEGTIDGMDFVFNSGTLFAGDEFTLTTDEDGTPQINYATDWHWTNTSFADQLNRRSPGITATVNQDNTMTLEANTNGRTIQNFSFTNTQYPSFSDPGFDSENVTINVDDYQALTRSGTGFRLQRNDGVWQVPALNDLGYDVTLTALDDVNMDNGFTVHLDGNRALTITFDTPVTNDGYMQTDMADLTGNYSIAFGDDENDTAGVAAALGFNTFFDGVDSMAIHVNPLVSDMNYIAAGKVDADTGELSVGQNENAFALANIQFESVVMPQWTFNRGEDNVSRRLDATVEEYYQSLLGKTGIKALNIRNMKSFSETMVKKLTEQRDSISAVSIDEEMINLMKYQQAYSVAAKLLTVTDEMLNTLIGVR